MRWLDAMSETIKRGIRSWLNVLPASPSQIQINEVLDFEASAIRNRIWYRGDSNELMQLYTQNMDYADQYKFWACASTAGMEIRKIHTGLPGMIVRVLSSVVLADMNGFEFPDEAAKSIWEEIEKDNDTRKKLEKAIKEVLYIGDGAFKVVIDTTISEYPILEWYTGERVEFIRHRDRIREVIFKTPYRERGQTYILNERYGYGYIKNELYKDGKLVDINSIPATAGLSDWLFDNSVILAVPLMVFESAKYEGRGGSIFDGKLDSFDAFDEVWSQWMDALRAGRARTYIPESYVPRDPYNGTLMRPNPFDNRFIAGDNDMSENGKNIIQTEQPSIPHESYLASYITALDLCLQGIISPSTLGIDTKKLDNAEAQREKEKATLYTRNAIVKALQETLPELVRTAINAYNLARNLPLRDIDIDIPFGEYANPSFESQVETISKGKQGGIMSIEAAIEELYGDSRDDEWKAEEVARLKAEQGIQNMEEPSVNLEAGTFQVKGFQGGVANEGQSRKTDVPDEPEGVSGASGGGEGTGSKRDLRSRKE